MPKLKLYVIKKYVWAESAAKAIKLDKKAPPEDVWIDDDWKKKDESSKAFMGFKK